MDNVRMEVPKYTPKVKVYVHLIRHARALHNHNPSTLTPAQIETIIAMRDPALAPHGEAEALDLLHRFPHHSQLTHILTSPLRRTLQTTIIALSPAIMAGVHPIAITELRETGNRPNSTGSEITGLLREFGDLGRAVLADTLDWGWEYNLEEHHMVGERVDKVLRMLKDLGDLARGQAIAPDSGSGMKEIWGLYGFQPVEEGKDIHIAVVSHSDTLWKMTGEVLRDVFYNAEFRTYCFREGDENDLKEGKKAWDLVETQESLTRKHPSTGKEALAQRAAERERLCGMGVNNRGSDPEKFLVEHVEDEGGVGLSHSDGLFIEHVEDGGVPI